MALFHIKFQSIPSLILFTLSDDPQFFGLEVPLSNILMIGLFRSNNKMLIFFKTEKKYSKNVLKFVKCLQFFFAFQQKIYCSILQMEGVGGHTIGYIVWTS